jgi:L-malate glycosyltransferase
MPRSSLNLLMIGSGRSYHATRWANALAEAGITVSFVTVHKKERPVLDAVNIIELPSVGRASYLLNGKRLRRLIRNIRPDLIHSHSAGGYGILGRLSNFRPRIVSVYGSDVYEAPTRSGFHKAYIGHVLKSADQVLATSHVMAEHVQELYPRLRPAIVTPFGVDLSLFSPGPSRNGGVGVTRVGLVKKLLPVYGIDILIDAFAMLPASDQAPIELHIVGDGPAKNQLHARARESGRGDDIFFHSAVPNSLVPDVLRTFDIFVVPSRSEGFGVAAVEAAAVGLPAIVSDVGGLPEVVEHERTGLVVPPEDARAFAASIRRLAENPIERARFGVAARQRAASEYDWNENVARMIDVYRDVLSRNGDR